MLINHQVLKGERDGKDYLEAINRKGFTPFGIRPGVLFLNVSDSKYLSGLEILGIIF